MRPAFSVLFLTTLIGAGQGLFIALFFVELFAAASVTPGFFVGGSLLVLVLCGLGLIASFFHLGHPERAWRAAMMWRTSWLSREVIVLPAFIALRLTGEPVADPGNAGSTGLLDEGTLGWWPEAVAAVGVDPALLGRVAPAGSAIGGLSPEAAQELGLPEGIPVGTGANDQSSAAVAMGNRQPGQLSATIGTAMAVVGLMIFAKKCENLDLAKVLLINNSIHNRKAWIGRMLCDK